MRLQILTIFPELFQDFSSIGLVSRAVAQKQIELSTINIRDFAVNTHGQVDDTPYGGGSGMVLRPEPAVGAIERARESDPNAKVILFSPRGKRFSQQIARDLLNGQKEKNAGAILLCSRYEGVDQRVIDGWVDLELSLGDYILMGGEIAAMAFVETITRLIPGVLGNPESTVAESFEHGALEHSHYTKPSNFRGIEVPEVLLSGNHALIEQFRADESRRITLERRPDLLPAQPQRASELSVALIHFPVLNKEEKIVTSSVTNLDLHDIARSARTYGLARYYVVHPVKTMRRLCEKILEHWSTGYGATYNRTRTDALECLRLVPDLEDCILDIESRTGEMPKLITTSARRSPKTISFCEMRRVLEHDKRPHLMLLGTGWGLAQEIFERADYHLEPIVGPTDYNHLSVRAAASIMFDRLLG